MAKGKNTPQSLDLASLSQEELLAKATELQASNETLVAKVSDLEKVIDELSQANTVKVTGNEISHAGSVFKLVTPKFWLGGQLITKEVLEADASLIASAIEHGNLVEITQE